VSVLSLPYFQRRQQRKQQAVSTIDEAIPLLASNQDLDDEAVEAAQEQARLSDEELERLITKCRGRMELIQQINDANAAGDKLATLQSRIDEMEAAETARRDAYSNKLQPLIDQRNDLRLRAQTTAQNRLIAECDPRIVERLAELGAQRVQLDNRKSYAERALARAKADYAKAVEAEGGWAARAKQTFNDVNAHIGRQAANNVVASQSAITASKAEADKQARTVAEAGEELRSVEAAIRRLEGLKLAVWPTQQQIDEAAAV